VPCGRGTACVGIAIGCLFFTATVSGALGVLMWVPGGLVHAGAGLVLLARKLAQGGDTRAHALE
jgi:hypothetical protein